MKTRMKELRNFYPDAKTEDWKLMMRYSRSGDQERRWRRGYCSLWHRGHADKV